jgi:hypothetical protein
MSKPVALGFRYDHRQFTVSALYLRLDSYFLAFNLLRVTFATPLFSLPHNPEKLVT